MTSEEGEQPSNSDSDSLKDTPSSSFSISVKEAMELSWVTLGCICSSRDVPGFRIVTSVGIFSVSKTALKPMVCYTWDSLNSY
jgi:hypothetical protein